MGGACERQGGTYLGGACGQAGLWAGWTYLGGVCG